MDRFKYEMDEALAWQRGINAKRAAQDKPLREPFYMSKSLLMRIKVEAILKQIEEARTRQAIAERLARVQQEAVMDCLAHQNEAVVAFHQTEVLEMLMPVLLAE
jgi:hypothetical protein